MLESKRVLVTGGSGVIGRELLELLLRSDVSEILSLDRLPSDFQPNDRLQTKELNLATDSLECIINFDPHVVMHLAASFERTEESPSFFGTNWHDNLVLSHRLIKALQDCIYLEKFVFASSYLVYSPELYLGQNHVRYLKEIDTIHPRNLVGAAKFYSELELNYAKRVLWPSVSIANARIFRVFGCGSKDVVSRWIRAALRGNEIEVWGEANQFDFVYAGDIAEGIMRIAASPGACGCLNLGSGVPTSIRQVIDAIRTCAGDTKIITKETSDPIELSAADLNLLELRTGWRPQPHNMIERIRPVVNYEKAMAAAY